MATIDYKMKNAFNRRVAELIGYKVRSNTDYWYRGSEPGTLFWIADNKLGFDVSLKFESPDLAWGNANLPNFYRSLDAAFTLTIPDKEDLTGFATLELSGSGESWTATFFRGETQAYRHDYSDSASHPAEAVSLAWLQYAESADYLGKGESANATQK
jgi:hypothetical protein